MTTSERLEQTRHSLNLFDAQVSVFGNRVANWYLLEANHGQHGTVRKVSTATARAMFVDKIRALENGMRATAFKWTPETARQHVGGTFGT